MRLSTVRWPPRSVRASGAAGLARAQTLGSGPPCLHHSSLSKRPQISSKVVVHSFIEVEYISYSDIQISNVAE